MCTHIHTHIGTSEFGHICLSVTCHIQPHSSGLSPVVSLCTTKVNIKLFFKRGLCNVYLASAWMVYMSTVSNTEKCITPNNLLGIHPSLDYVRKWLNKFTFIVKQAL